jgi:flavin-dependent dehydrogenase
MVVGDSALTVDPLSSMGISLALMSGVACANTLLRCDKEGIVEGGKGREKSNSTGMGERGAAEDAIAGHMNFYAGGLESLFHQFLERKATYYSKEKRFPDLEFWKRRSFAQNRKQ